MIGISYRRHDAEITTGRLFGHLERAFGAEALILDRMDEPADALLQRQLVDEVRRSDLLLVVMGRRWLSEPDGGHGRALHCVNDPVRLQVETALRYHKLVLPVLVDEARRPSLSDLPLPLQPLARRSPVRLDNGRFQADVRNLVGFMRELLDDAAEREPTVHFSPRDVIGSIKDAPIRPIPLPQASKTVSDPNPAPLDPGRPVSPSHALMVIRDETVVDVVRRRFGHRLMGTAKSRRADGANPRTSPNNKRTR